MGFVNRGYPLGFRKFVEPPKTVKVLNEQTDGTDNSPKKIVPVLSE